MAHITGGGIPGNLARQFPDGLGAEIDTSTWERQPVFGWLASLGVDDDEMWRVFNMGLGFARGHRGRVDGRRAQGPRAGRHARLRGGPGGRGRRSDPALRVGVLISGEGTNLQALIDAPDIDVACVVSSRAGGAGGSPAPRRAGIPATRHDRRGRDGRVPRSPRRRAGRARGVHADPLGRRSSSRFPGRIVNVHPSLLPAFPGRTAVSRRARARRPRHRRHRPHGRGTGRQRADSQAGGGRGSV